jgi:predicted glycoside hydrolase/deacetylase ChbG (UPF0249 family)
MNSSIDAAILRLGRLGHLNATTCLVQGPSFAEDCAALQTSGLQIGLHLNFTESLGRPGLYLPVSRLIALSYLGGLDRAQVRTQIAEQLDLFDAALGRAPDFIDGHQHVHQLPGIRHVLLQELVQRYGTKRKPWLRFTGPASLAGMPLSMRLKARFIGMLGAQRFERQARAGGFRCNTDFLGVYDFQGGQVAYSGLVQQWLAQISDGGLIMCHPAAEPLKTDPLGQQRHAEFKVLSSPQMGVWLQNNGIQL